jgi:hypothetical protein
MDANDRKAIEDLFDRLSDVERRSPPRDPQAEALINSAVAQAPAAPYYMAQTIVIQKQALDAAEQRIAELESGGRESEGLFSGLFGGRSRQPARSPERRAAERRQPAGPWNQGYGQGGFLAGAAQTAMGVAGGILLGNLIAGAFASHSATAAEPGNADTGSNDDASNDATGDTDDGGSDFADAGDFGGGDFGGDF